MTRRALALQALSLASLSREYPAFSLKELEKLTGRTRYSLMGDIERGDLKAFQFTNRPGSKWQVWPADARDWLKRLEARTRESLKLSEHELHKPAET